MWVSSSNEVGVPDRREGALPLPSDLEREHSQRLTALIRQRLSEGPLSFAEYMELALYAPGLGYYMAGARKFGAGGDFITAPEVSPLFGRALAVQCREILDGLDAGSQQTILEIGAGSGALAVAILSSLSDLTMLHYQVLEPSPELADRQRATIAAALGAEALARVSWLSELPEEIHGVIIANEVVDALPAERFLKRSDALGDIWQVGVGAESADDRLIDVATEAPTALRDAIEAIESDLDTPLPAGYASELNLQAGPWLTAVAASLSHGVMLLIDYGYPRRERYSAERGRGTLACYYRHRAHDDAYRWPGLQDITTHVDFTSLAEAGTAAGLDFLGYTSQAAFLMANDVLALAEAEMAQAESEPERIAVSRAVKTLTLPGEMGERFQVLALGKVYARELRGLSLQDLSYRL